MKVLFLSALLVSIAIGVFAQPAQVKISNGTLTGTYNSITGITSFKGIPYAQPPVGKLRWVEPQPAANWMGTLKADHFSHMPMQKRIFSDMIFRADTTSEDCLYLNVWTPAKTGKEKLPVLVYFYGGGFVAGDGSEERYDGESMAQKGIVTITISYRLGIFGFFSHPELTAESAHKASGNYSLLDQYAALKWVKQNIAAFGGDPKRVTIAGESAGSISVSAQMASPLSKNLIAGAIGESGAMIKPTAPAIPLADNEKRGLAFAEKSGVKTLAELRDMPAVQLLDAASKPSAWSLAATIDGYFFTKSPEETFAAGEQAHVPLLAGWNSTEIPYASFTGGDDPTTENYAAKVKQQFGENAAEVLKLYPGNTQAEVISSATALASDRFIVYSTWSWADLHSKTSGKPVYRYVFSKPRPKNADDLKREKESTRPPAYNGASHASEIEYALGNLHYNKVYPWTADDFRVSETMENYFANFIKTGNPNGPGLPDWPVLVSGVNSKFINIDTSTRAETKTDRARYLFLEKFFGR